MEFILHTKNGRNYTTIYIFTCILNAHVWGLEPKTPRFVLEQIQCRHIADAWPMPDGNQSLAKQAQVSVYPTTQYIQARIVNYTRLFLTRFFCGPWLSEKLVQTSEIL